MEAKPLEQLQPMTIDRLRRHLFGGPQVPFWNFDPARLTFGLEVEFFIGRASSAQMLATRTQFLEVVEYLCRHFGYRNDKSLSPGRVSKDTSQGFIAIKPDFAWHILEIAFPPRGSLNELRSILEDVFREVDLALSSQGLSRLDLSCLPNVPQHLEFVELDRLRGYINSAKSSDPSRLETLRIFPALIAATHVHVNCCNEEALAMLPGLYRQEVAALERFTRAKNFNGQRYENVRSEFYERALGDDYTLRTIPKTIPDCLETYVQLLNACTKAFPHDKFFPARDMSYIRPTTYGTLEFRSSCSFLSIDTLLQIVEFRRRQVLTAQDYLLASVSDVVP